MTINTALHRHLPTSHAPALPKTPAWSSGLTQTICGADRAAPAPRWPRRREVADDLSKRLRAALPDMSNSVSYSMTLRDHEVEWMLDRIERLIRERDEARALADEHRGAERELALTYAQRDALRAEVEHLTLERDAAKAFHDVAVKERDYERAEVERLRATLQYIAADGCDEIGDYDSHRVTTTCLERGDGDPCHPCRARAALAEGEGGDDE